MAETGDGAPLLRDFEPTTALTSRSLPHIARIHVERASSCSDNTLSYSSAVICTTPERNQAAFAWT